MVEMVEGLKCKVEYCKYVFNQDVFLVGGRGYFNTACQMQMIKMFANLFEGGNIPVYMHFIDK